MKKKEADEALKKAKEARDKANDKAKAAFVADSTYSAAREAANKAHSFYEECRCW